MGLMRYYQSLSASQQEKFLAQVGTTKRYFEYFLLGIGNNSGEKRFPRMPLVDAIHDACAGNVTYLEVICDLIPKAKKDLDFLLRAGVAGAAERPRPIETNDSTSRLGNGDQSITSVVSADQSTHGE